MSDPTDGFDLDDLTDDELMEVLLLRAGEMDEERGKAALDKVLAEVEGDQQKALALLEQRRGELVEQAIDRIKDLGPASEVIFAHDLLLDQLDVES